MAPEKRAGGSKKLETRTFLLISAFSNNQIKTVKKVMDEARMRLEKAEAELDDLEESQV